MASWAEDLQIYERSKRGPLTLRPPSPSKRVVRTQKKSREPIDVVLQRYRDPEVEGLCCIRERRQLIDTINKGKDWAIEREGVVDNINHRSKYMGGTKIVPPEFVKPHRRTYETKRSGVSYNIIDNNPLPGTKPEKKPPPSFSMKTAMEAREFDIISNSYHVNDEKKKAMDSEFVMRDAMEKYWKKNVFDVVQCTFTHPDMEAKFTAERDQAKYLHGERALRAMPQCVRESEGQLFNIVNINPVHPELLAEYDQKNAARKAGRKVRYAFEKMNRNRIYDMQEREKQRALRRIAHKRYENTVNRGYRVINNISFEGSQGIPPPDPQTFPRDPLSSVLNASDPQPGTPAQQEEALTSATEIEQVNPPIAVEADPGTEGSTADPSANETMVSQSFPAAAEGAERPSLSRSQQAPRSSSISRVSVPSLRVEEAIRASKTPPRSMSSIASRSGSNSRTTRTPAAQHLNSEPQDSPQKPSSRSASECSFKLVRSSGFSRD